MATDLQDYQQRGFLFLPVEVRLQIYEDYLSSVFSRPSSAAYFSKSIREPNERCDVPIMRLNRQINQEVTDFIRRLDTTTCRVTSRDAGIDPRVRWSLKARQHLSEVPIPRRVVLDIYPPHPDRLVDMAHIWRRVKEECDRLRALGRVSALTVRFVEDDIATWSPNRAEMWRKLVCRWDEDPSNCYVRNVLAVSQRLDNISKARVILPPSLAADENLLGLAEETETSMMGMCDAETREFREKVYGMLDRYITDECTMMTLEVATGRASKARFERIYGENPRLHSDEYQRFTDDWPHMDELMEEDRPRYSILDNNQSSRGDPP